MPKSRHRKFNADRFLDKFRCYESTLRNYCEKWREGLDGLPELLTVENFKDFLRHSAVRRVAYKGLKRGRRA